MLNIENILKMNVPAFDLNLLKAFEALMDERAVTRAGQRRFAPAEWAETYRRFGYFVRSLVEMIDVKRAAFRSPCGSRPIPNFRAGERPVHAGQNGFQRGHDDVPVNPHAEQRYLARQAKLHIGDGTCVGA
jgi:hypothetical protein